MRYINAIFIHSLTRNSFPLISSEDCRPWNPISPHRNVHCQEWKERKKNHRFSKDVMAKISGRERKVGACKELYFPGVG
mgnify:CR=1 FL=1